MSSFFGKSCLSNVCCARSCLAAHTDRPVLSTGAYLDFKRPVEDLLQQGHHGRSSPSGEIPSNLHCWPGGIRRVHGWLPLQLLAEVDLGKRFRGLWRRLDVAGPEGQRPGLWLMHHSDFGLPSRPRRWPLPGSPANDASGAIDSTQCRRVNLLTDAFTKLRHATQAPGVTGAEGSQFVGKVTDGAECCLNRIAFNRRYCKDCANCAVNFEETKIENMNPYQAYLQEHRQVRAE